MLKIEYQPLAALVPYVRNARTHSPAQLAKLEASLAEFGWTTPMVVAKKHMLAGHGRLAAALGLQAKGIEIPGNKDAAKGPTVDVSHLSPVQRRAYILADNRLALEYIGAASASTQDSSWAAFGTKAIEIDDDRKIASLTREFDLMWPGGKSVGRADQIITAWRAAQARTG